ncbi:MAG: pyridoxamine 5'-phosphate oxidase family protein [Candidatus Pelethousia sp.]|nr:pyridoxamine 5'-phosphate oxidase family protein [Candidatus Pelethousia sp.]
MPNAPHPMRRAERAIATLPDIMAILEQCDALRLGLTGPEGPYVVPLNFGFEEKDGSLTIFFHCAKAGRKADMLAADPRVCIEADCNHKLISGPKPCAYSFAYESVIGFGKARLLTEDADKAVGLSRIMARFSPAASFEFESAVLARTAVYAIDVEHITGKRHD